MTDGAVQIFQWPAVEELGVERSPRDPTALLRQEPADQQTDGPARQRERSREEEARDEGRQQYSGQEREVADRQWCGPYRAPTRDLPGERFAVAPHIVGGGGRQIAGEAEVGVGQRSTRDRRHGGQLRPLARVDEVQHRPESEQAGAMAATRQRHRDVLIRVCQPRPLLTRTVSHRRATMENESPEGEARSHAGGTQRSSRDELLMASGGWVRVSRGNEGDHHVDVVLGVRRREPRWLSRSSRGAPGTRRSRTTRTPSSHRCATQCPVHHVRLGDGHDAWIVVGHDAARQALKDPRLSKDMIAAMDADPDVVDEGLPGPAFARHMLAVDPPDHTRLRGSSPGRSPRRASPRSSRRSSASPHELLDELRAVGSGGRSRRGLRRAVPVPGDRRAARRSVSTTSPRSTRRSGRCSSRGAVRRRRRPSPRPTRSSRTSRSSSSRIARRRPTTSSACWSTRATTTSG